MTTWNDIWTDIWTEESNEGEGFAVCGCDDIAGCTCDINGIDGLGDLIEESRADDQLAVYQADDGTVTLVGNSHGPWAVTVDSYTVLISDWGPGEVTEEEAEAACERMQERLGERYSVRAPRQGEAEGTYRNKRDGTLQILGFTLPVPPHVHEATGQAWVHAGETWPTTTEETDR